MSKDQWDNGCIVPNGFSRCRVKPVAMKTNFNQSDLDLSTQKQLGSLREIVDFNVSPNKLNIGVFLPKPQ